MAYKKRTYRRKRTYKKRNTANTWGNTAKKALKVAMGVARLINAESKHVDTLQNAQNIDFNGTIVSLCVPPQGVGSDERTGDSIKIQNCTIRGVINRNGADCVVRMILLWDKDGDIVNPNNFLENVGSVFAVISPSN